MSVIKAKLVLTLAIALMYLGCGIQASAQEIASPDPSRAPYKKRLITVEDTIRMTKLGDPYYFGGVSSVGRVAQMSPDRSKFVIVLRSGNLEQNTNEYSMLLWNANTALTSAAPQVILRMSSSSNREAIADVRWLFDNETITFLGEHSGEQRQLYEVNVRSHDLKKLTNHPTSLLSYALSTAGDKIAFVSQAPLESLWDEDSRRHGVVVSRQSIPELLTGREGSDDEELYLQAPDGTLRVNLHGKRVGTPCFSPDSRYIVVPVRVSTADVPETWTHYRNGTLKLFNRVDAQRIPPTTSLLARYEVVDTKTGNSRVLLDSPIWPPYTEPVWLPDSRSVILSNVFLPYENVAGVEQKAGEYEKLMVELRISDNKVTRIGNGQLRAVRWDERTRQLICQTVPLPGQFLAMNSRKSTNTRPRVYLTKNGDHWQQSSGSFQENMGLEIVLNEGMNDPPKIYARQPRTHQERLLLDLNPQFDELRFGRVEEIQWPWSKGHVIKAGLYYPPNYVPGKRYPLVIQTHEWSPNRFWIDGPWTTAYAAQPLAAKDIMVLQVLDEYIPLNFGRTGQKKEVEKALAIYESAIHYLDTKGIIDRKRVGLIGFSHTCFYVKYALAHSRVKFAAASVTEGEDGGYLQFMTNKNLFVDAYSLYGGRPFGKGLKAWTQVSPGFNVDRTHTPLRITVLASQELMLDWEWFEALTLLGKPVDMIMMQDGTHLLQKPWDRIVSQQGNVDWFDFWLNSHEDPDPMKSAQYKRWRGLRNMPSEVVEKPFNGLPN